MYLKGVGFQLILTFERHRVTRWSIGCSPRPIRRWARIRAWGNCFAGTMNKFFTYLLLIAFLFFPKTLIRLLLQLIPYLGQTGLLPPTQSRFRACHSTTETAFLSLLSPIYGHWPITYMYPASGLRPNCLSHQPLTWLTVRSCFYTCSYTVVSPLLWFKSYLSVKWVFPYRVN